MEKHNFSLSDVSKISYLKYPTNVIIGENSVTLHGKFEKKSSSYFNSAVAHNSTMAICEQQVPISWIEIVKSKISKVKVASSVTINCPNVILELHKNDILTLRDNRFESISSTSNRSTATIGEHTLIFTKAVIDGLGGTTLTLPEIPQSIYNITVQRSVVSFAKEKIITISRDSGAWSAVTFKLKGTKPITTYFNSIYFSTSNSYFITGTIYNSGTKQFVLKNGDVKTLKLRNGRQYKVIATTDGDTIKVKKGKKLSFEDYKEL